MAEGGGLQSNSGARHRILYPELPCPRHSVATGNHRGNNKALEKAISPPPTGRSRNNWSKAMVPQPQSPPILYKLYSGFKISYFSQLSGKNVPFTSIYQMSKRFVDTIKTDRVIVFDQPPIGQIRLNYHIQKYRLDNVAIYRLSNLKLTCSNTFPRPVSIDNCIQQPKLDEESVFRAPGDPYHCR